MLYAGGMKRANDDDKNRMREMFEAGAILKEVSEVVGLNISAVSKWRIKMNLVPEGYNSSKRRDLAEKARHLYVDLGWSQNRVGRELGIDRVTVRKWAKENNWNQTSREESPNSWARERPDNETLLAVWQDTMQLASNFKTKRGSCIRVAEKLKVSSSTAQRWLTDAGISNDTHSEVVAIRAEIIEMFRHGKLVQDIVEETGTTKVFVSKTLREAGHTVPTLMEERYEEIKDKLPAAWERSKRWNKTTKKLMGSAVRVGKEFGVSASTAQRWLVMAGIIEPRGATFDTEHAVRLFGEGWSIPRIAVELDTSENAVRKWLSSAGHDLHNPHQRRTHEEKIAFRRSVSTGKVASVSGSGRYNYKGVRLDSSYEVRFAESCDRLGLTWRPYNRADDGVCEVEIKGEVARYAPDFFVGQLPIEIKGIFDGLAADKVKTWRQDRGKLAMIMKTELLDFESARNSEDALATLQAACYLDPPTDPAFWD